MMAYGEMMRTPSLGAFAASGVLDSNRAAIPRVVPGRLGSAGALVLPRRRA
jgi:hypothetical protein